MQQLKIHQEQLYIACIVLFLVGTIYLYFNMRRAKEGFQDSTTSGKAPASAPASAEAPTSSGVGIGQASNANSHATALKNQLEHWKDTMNIGKYRADYENTIIYLDDIISYEMLQTSVNMDTNMDINKQMADIEKINKLSAARDNLNSLMKWVDKQ
jgi:hypothetical protein